LCRRSLFRSDGDSVNNDSSSSSDSSSDDDKKDDSDSSSSDDDDKKDDRIAGATKTTRDECVLGVHAAWEANE
jgi:hypothetical protein